MQKLVYTLNALNQSEIIIEILTDLSLLTKGYKNRFFRSFISFYFDSWNYMWIEFKAYNMPRASSAKIKNLKNLNKFKNNYAKMETDQSSDEDDDQYDPIIEAHNTNSVLGETDISEEKFPKVCY